MSVLFYKFAHRVGMTPWERLTMLPAAKAAPRAVGSRGEPTPAAIRIGARPRLWHRKLVGEAGGARMGCHRNRNRLNGP